MNIDNFFALVMFTLIAILLIALVVTGLRITVARNVDDFIDLMNGYGYIGSHWLTAGLLAALTFLFFKDGMSDLPRTLFCVRGGLVLLIAANLLLRQGIGATTRSFRLN